ncbi:hypothetical protein HU200_013507 [Digitaria exilis]|uniref:Uncharacterized protein n=1 Tax=Digitaria exilis TaxID=1010633 RepID=A0A835KMA6_9POAL|nr:hypothetical protein HU200_013507 [Digitaria exilis]
MPAQGHNLPGRFPTRKWISARLSSDAGPFLPCTTGGHSTNSVGGEAAPTKELWLSLRPHDGQQGPHASSPSSTAPALPSRMPLGSRRGWPRRWRPSTRSAGRLGVDGDGRTQISCNGEGALFIGDVLFLALSQRPSFWLMFHFMQTWSAFTRDGEGAAAVELPCHDRTLLRARSPPVVVDLATLSRCSPISRDQLIALRRLCGGASTFCSVSALVWQCTSVARRLQPDAEARLNFPANVRRRMASQLVPDCYFSNALVFLGAAAAAGDIASEALASVAGRIGGAHRKDGRRAGAVAGWMDGRCGAHAGDGAPDHQLARHAGSVRGGVVYLIDDGPETCSAAPAAAGNIKEFGRLFYASIAEASKKLALDN